MATPGTDATGGSAGGSGGIAPELSSDRPSLRETPTLLLPDWLRSLTVTRFAPYRIIPYALVQDERTPFLTANAMRVGILLTVTGLAAGRVTITTADAPAGAVVYRIENDGTRTGMLADLFSLITSGWVATAPGDCTLTVIEYVRPM